MADSLRHIIELIERTGDRCIVLDADGRPAYALMSVAQYEQLVLSSPAAAEHKVAGKIKDQVQDWKAQPSRSAGNSSRVDSAEKAVNLDETQAAEDRYYFEPIE